MLALLLAAQVVAAPTTAIAFNELAGRLPPRRGDLLSTIPDACRLGVTAVAQPRRGGVPPRPVPPIAHRLGDLPKAHLEIAVNRTVGGCPAPVIVRYDVEGDGRAATGGSGR